MKSKPLKLNPYAMEFTMTPPAADPPAFAPASDAAPLPPAQEHVAYPVPPSPAPTGYYGPQTQAYASPPQAPASDLAHQYAQASQQFSNQQYMQQQLQGYQQRRQQQREQQRAPGRSDSWRRKGGSRTSHRCSTADPGCHG